MLSARLALLVLTTASTTVACAESTFDPLYGGELLLEVGELRFYSALDDEVCAGTMRRLELHTLALAELFEVDPPRAQVVLFADTESAGEACSNPKSAGCGGRNGAYATTANVLHELVHVFVAHITERSTRPAIQEGMAEALRGEPIERLQPLSLDDMESMLRIRGTLSVDYDHAHHFFAWIIDRFGLESAIDVHAITAGITDDDAFETALVQALGFSSLAQLHQAYEATSADYYPAFPDTARVFTADELRSGVEIDTSCEGDYTEGPLDRWIWTMPIIEVEAIGQHGVGLERPAWFRVTPAINLRPGEPAYDWPASFSERTKLDAESCPYDTQPPRYVFPSPGRYEIVLGSSSSSQDLQERSWSRGWHLPEDAFATTLSVEYVGGDECSYP